MSIPLRLRFKLDARLGKLGSWGQMKIFEATRQRAASKDFFNQRINSIRHNKKVA
jgi:hypothetical protein